MILYIGVYAAVRAYRFYNSNKNKVLSYNGEDVISIQPAKIKIDGLFNFYADNKYHHMPIRRKDTKFTPNKHIMDCEDN